MEILSKILFLCGGTVALYQMSGTPFILNIAIFCFCTVLGLYTMFISGFLIPSEPLYDLFFEDTSQNNGKTSKLKKTNSSDWESMQYPDDEITKRLREITGHIVRDFILSWYNTVSDDVTFVQEAFELFEHLLKGTRRRVSSVDREILITDILSKILEHYNAYREIVEQTDDKTNKTKLNEEDLKRKEQLDAVAYCKEHSHPALHDLPDSEMEYLRGLVVLLLKGLLPGDYKLNQTALYIVRELIAQNVLNSLVELVSDPLWIYKTVVKILEEETNSESSDDISENQEGNEVGIGFASNETVEILEQEDVPTITEDLDNNLSEATDDEEVMNSQTTASICSLDSFEARLVSSSIEEEIPLPMTSSLMHFAPEKVETANMIDISMSSESSVVMATRNSTHDRLFLRIRLLESITMQENFEGGGKYTLYRITYKTMKKRESSPPPSGSTDINQSTASNCSEVQHSNPHRAEKHWVQRRFREFLVLQERLSQNMVAKNLISDIKGPSRMFPVPFGNMDKEYIEQRRKFLQAYLREICSIPFINNSREMREFLAYESDPWIAYVRKPDPLPRLDKLLKSAILDLFGSTTMKFSNTLHSEDDDEAENEHLSGPKKAQKSDPNSLVDLEESSGPVAKLKSIVLGSSARLMRLEDSSERQYQAFQGPKNTIPVSWLDPLKIRRSIPSVNQLEMRFYTRTSGDGCDAETSSGSEKNDGDSGCSSQSGTVDVLFKLMLHIWDIKPGTHNILVLSLSKFVDRYLEKKIDKLTTKESWSRYLKALRDSLWPNGQWSSNKGETVTWSNASDEIKSKAMHDAQTSLESAFPDLIKHLVGEGRYREGVSQLVQSFQNVNINRHLVYFLLDLILRQVYPDLSEVLFHMNISLTAVPIT